MKKLNSQTFGSTNCALPMQHAVKHKMDVDCFVIITDNETYQGNVHPFRALQEYRNKMNKPNARMIVVGMTATGFTICDPNDPGSMDVVGFDINTPKLIQEFGSGKI